VVSRWIVIGNGRFASQYAVSNVFIKELYLDKNNDQFHLMIHHLDPEVTSVVA